MPAFLRSACNNNTVAVALATMDKDMGRHGQMYCNLYNLARKENLTSQEKETLAALQEKYWLLTKNMVIEDETEEVEAEGTKEALGGVLSMQEE
jgi:hypothetical protein